MVQTPRLVTERSRSLAGLNFFQTDYVVRCSCERISPYGRNDMLSYREGGENDGVRAAIIFTRFSLRGSHFEHSEKSHVI